MSEAEILTRKEELNKLLSIYKQHRNYQKKLVLITKNPEDRLNFLGEIKSLEIRINDVESKLKLLNIQQQR